MRAPKSLATTATQKMIRLSMSLLILVIASCHPGITKIIAAPPRLAKLVPLAEIAAPKLSGFSGVAGLASCDILLADRSGRIFSSRNGSDVLLLGTVPGERAPELETVNGLDVIAWADPQPLLARITLDPFGIDSLPVLRHPWGERWVGPVVPLEHGRLAMAPIAHPYRFRPAPNHAPQARLADVLDAEGSLLTTVGPALHAVAGYRAWAQVKGAIGRQGDTLLSVAFEDGLLYRYPVSVNSSLGKTFLPRYFKPVTLREEVVRFPWIRFGELAYVFSTPQISQASFGPNGTLYAIRNYGFSWQGRKNVYVRSAGAWTPTAQGLEVYTPYGRLIGAYEIPVRTRSVRADVTGRLFLTLQSGGIEVYQDPTARPTSCPSIHPASRLIGR